MTQINVLEGVVQHEFGETVTLTLIDQDTGLALDVSAYDGTKEVVFRHKDGQTTVTRTLSFSGGGTDGKVTFTFASGNIIKPGTWKGQVKLRNAGETIISFSKTFTMEVDPNVWVST